MNIHTRARSLQIATRWPYQTCLQKIRELADQPARMAGQEGWSIDRADLFLLAPEKLDQLADLIEIAASETIPPDTEQALAVICEQGPFAPDSLIIPEHVALHCLICDYRIGRNSQFVSSGPISGDFFTEKYHCNDVCVDVLPRGCQITLNVRNLQHDHALDFEASVAGHLVSTDTRQQRTNRRSVLGLGRTNVPPRRKIKVTLRSQVVFKPDCLVVTPQPGLVVTGARAAGLNLLKDKFQGGKVELDSPILQVGDWFCVDVENTLDSAVAIVGGVGGTIVH